MSANSLAEEQELSPEALAYAMPGGFAALATDGEWKYGRHHALIEDKLLEVAEGKCRRLMVSLPPQNGKSTLVSQFFTAWYLGRYPYKRVILTSYEATFAASWGRKSRTLLEQYGKDVFGVGVSQASAAADNWETDVKGLAGGMRTAGAGGPITGKGADLIIIDDPVKNDKEALSQRQQDDIWEWYRATVYTRQSPDCAIILIMTRWSTEDLAGRLLKEMKENPESSDEWEVINLPAIAEEDDPLGRQPGEALWPERYDEKWLKRTKSVMGTYWWSALYQQRPTAVEGDMIRIGWFKRYLAPPGDIVKWAKHEFDEIVISWDTAQKETELNDYTVAGVWGVTEYGYYLLDLVRDRYSHPRLLAVAKTLNSKWTPNVNIIEDKASGVSLIQHLEAETRIPVFKMTPDQNKIVRMSNESPQIESGNVYLPDPGMVNTSWLFDFEEECRGFPNTIYKDQIDMMSQFLKWAREKIAYRLEMW